MAEVQLHGSKAAGRTALVDDADLELVSGYQWRVYECVRPGGGIDGPYAMTHIYRGVHRTTIRMHQLITGWRQTDHRNRNGLDNHRHNLRVATNGQNQCNTTKRPGTTSQYIGVAWHKRNNRWIATVREDGRKRHLGYFTDEVDAARARDQAAIRLYGEFASLNFPG